MQLVFTSQFFMKNIVISLLFFLGVATPTYIIAVPRPQRVKPASLEKYIDISQMAKVSLFAIVGAGSIGSMLYTMLVTYTYAGYFGNVPWVIFLLSIELDIIAIATSYAGIKMALRKKDYGAA